MDWRDEDPPLGALFDRMFGPGAYYQLERQFWLALWRIPVLEAVDENGIEARHYGPVRAFVTPDRPRVSLFNLLLGADREYAVAGGHLAEALEWTESMGLDLRIPLRGVGEAGEPADAEDLLNHRGYRRSGVLATFARSVGPAGFSRPPGIEVEELAGESMAETFACIMESAYGFGPLGSDFFIGLPGERDWRTYIASDDSGPIAAAATMMHYDMPQLGFAGTLEGCGGRGGHLALLHRRLEDIAARPARSREVFAVTEESLEFPGGFSAGARNLIRAGFRLCDVRTVWQPPEELLAPEGEDDEEGDDRDDDRGPGDDHDFQLGD